jgi:8-oxo-dGTP pyrophosphatase MutT (NUDIX family)
MTFSESLGEHQISENPFTNVPNSMGTLMAADPAQPRRASTIVLVKAHGIGFQVYLLKRSGKSGFFPGSYVFPGGTVASEDAEADFWLEHSDLDRIGVERRLGGTLPAMEALAYGVAAIRETFEEAGVLIASRAQDPFSGMEAICEMRKTQRLSKGWIREWAVSGGWHLLLSLLDRWAHWITPEAFKPRFDTRFFLAFVPADQECSPDDRETTHGIWGAPAQALASNLKGETPLSPPTLVTLQELLQYKTLAELQDEVSRRGWGEPRLPRFVRAGKGAVILEPWDPMIREKDVEFDPAVLKKLILPVGEPFSRLWLHEGIWRPVATSSR